jgi:multidrug efflux pump
MRIWFDPAKMSAYGLTPSDVSAALARKNVELPSGKISGNTTELTALRTFGRLTTEEDFNNVILKNQNGGDIRLKDIGEAVLGPENETMLKESRIPMIATALIPQPGSNYVAISNEFYKRFDELKKKFPQTSN